MLQYKIAITLIPNVGHITGKKLIAYCGGVEGLFKEKKNNLKKIPGVGKAFVRTFNTKEALERAEKEIRFIEKFKINPMFYLDKTYPERLKHCEDGPMMIYMKGDADLNSQKVISIVGTRQATKYGKLSCQKIIKDLSADNVLIVSGLAFGIDACAHKSALENGLQTVGILAHGLDRIYPSVNIRLAQKMVKQGGLITEFITETNPDKENFPKRNRIIAGLSDAVLVVEAGNRGGALITADIANSYNRDVFAVPGRINDLFSEGCNWLIRTNQAALVQSAEDIKYLLGWEESSSGKKNIQKQLFVELNPEEEKVMQILKAQEEASSDWISLDGGMPVSIVSAILLNLEFKGVVKSLPGKMYRLL